MANNIYLVQGKNEIVFPVTPESLTYTINNKDTTVPLQSVGETVISQPLGLSTISWGSEFPAQYWYGCQYEDIPNPQDFVDALLLFKETGSFRLIIENSLTLDVTLSAFRYEEMANGDYNYSISFKEYRKPTVTRLERARGKVVVGSRPDTKPKPKTHTVGIGDTLWKIAKRYYNDGSKYKKIATKNNLESPYIIQVGEVLKI